jgi:hypothetical protein
VAGRAQDGGRRPGSPAPTGEMGGLRRRAARAGRVRPAAGR